MGRAELGERGDGVLCCVDSLEIVEHLKWKLKFGGFGGQVAYRLQ